VVEGFAPSAIGATMADFADQVRCPVLVIHGTHDSVRPFPESQAFASSTGGVLASLRGAGHGPHLRDPVQVNHLIKRFVDRVAR
jgi:pimeloyl-ACP methyl ester carboxylesterase